MRVGGGRRLSFQNSHQVKRVARRSPELWAASAPVHFGTHGVEMSRDARVSRSFESGTDTHGCPLCYQKYHHLEATNIVTWAVLLRVQ